MLPSETPVEPPGAAASATFKAPSHTAVTSARSGNHTYYDEKLYGKTTYKNSCRVIKTIITTTALTLWPWRAIVATVSRLKSGGKSRPSNWGGCYTAYTTPR